jgi:hypothetical protein
MDQGHCQITQCNLLELNDLFCVKFSGYLRLLHTSKLDRDPSFKRWRLLYCFGAWH